MLLSNSVNILAMVLSLIAMLTLIGVSLRLGGAIGRMLKLIVLGIFFSVFSHAAVELMGAYGLIGEDVLLIVMGTLLTLGSLLFILGAYTAYKSLR